MGLLAPLYALAALAIAGPVLFHLIRRQPQGKQPFSSLMFLQASPPRLTRRSRIDNWLLLMLRVLAIALIAFAFTRPYVREESLLNVDLEGRNVVVLLDTSASMQREDVWRAARQELDALLNSLSSGDRISLYAVDDRLNPIVPLTDNPRPDPVASQEAVRAATGELEPTWRRTELAQGLTAVADLLNADTISGGTQAGTVSEVVLITDLHPESGLKSLQGYPWPEEIRLDVRRVDPALPGNARPSLMAMDDDSEEAQVRIRVENNADSRVQNFELFWADESGTVDGSGTRLQVPAGQVRVIPMPNPLTRADRVRLRGDAWVADNDVLIIDPEPVLQRIAYVGTGGGDPEDDPAYFLKKAPLNSPRVRREVVVLPREKFASAFTDDSWKALVVEPVAEVLDRVDSLKAFAEQGGIVVVCFSRPVESYPSDPARLGSFLDSLLEVEGSGISEAEVDDYGLIGWVDYGSSVFGPFADPRYNDFSKIRIWNFRDLQLPEASDADLDAPNVVARLDSGAPFLVEQKKGEGRIWMLSAGWQPTSSGFALSSKFVPILLGLFDPEGTGRNSQMSYEVGEKIVAEAEDLEVVDRNGKALDESNVELGQGYLRIFRPGLFRLVSKGASGQMAPRTIAVEIPASESKLVPMDPDVFEQYGVGLGKMATEAERQDTARQMQVEELERKQRLWQWLIAAVIVILAVETFLAGWSAKRVDRQLAST